MLKINVEKSELKAFLKKISVGGNIEDAVVLVTENGFNFKGISKTKTFYADMQHKCKVEVSGDSNELIINNISIFNTTIDKVDSNMISLSFDGDVIEFNSKKKGMRLVASTPENINSNAVSSIDFNRKAKTYKCSAGEFVLDKAFTLTDKDIISINNDAKDLSINRFEFEFDVKKGKINVTVSNAGDSITTIIDTDLEAFDKNFQVKFGDDFKKITEVLVKDNEEVIFFADGTDDTNLLVYADGSYFFIVNDNTDEDFK